ncbi:S8 family serine peptidase [Chryseobacterium sp. RLHN22]|uniref:S8 family serine peptidase n=1 Tax=Chryseobacterium sp. RLHN22 TaxID=3437885 RepID=UPI003D9B50B1
MKKTYFLIMFLPIFIFSQTNEERRKIAESSNKAANATLRQELQSDESKRKNKIQNYLIQNPTAKKIVKDDASGKIELTDILPDGSPLYKATTNEGSAITARATSLYNGGSLGLNIQGQGMIAGVWDGGPVRDTHQEFMVDGFTKVSILDFTSTMSDHGTHVAGTIAAKGVIPAVRGLAFNSSIKSYDWNDDLTEMQSEASTGLLVSNHSYGPSLTNNSQLWVLGAYISDARQLDALCYNNPFYLPVYAAGNDRSKTAVPYGTQNASKFGYDLIAGDAVAKNALTVAAVNQVLQYVNDESVVMSSFSNYGPTDDGRIKPEISAKGVNVLSTTSNTDTSIGYKDGTSMAAPAVTGVVTLLQQYHNQLYNNYMKAATVKGLIMHTADEAGGAIGPDYGFGWGLINAEAAARLIRDKNLLSNRSVIRELNLNNGSTFTESVNMTSNRPLKVSISWTDPAAPVASVNNGVIDPSTKYLVNDLDLKVVAEDGTVYYPWKLQGLANAFSPATNNSTNDVDNFERVDIPNANGVYTILVTHKGSLVDSNQNFTLIVNGQNLSILNTNDVKQKENLIQIYPNPVKDVLNIRNSNIEAHVVILDTTGRIVVKDNVKDSKINVQNLVPGNYMLIYSDKQNREVSLKFIKN